MMETLSTPCEHSSDAGTCAGLDELPSTVIELTDPPTLEFGQDVIVGNHQYVVSHTFLDDTAYLILRR